jgi:hypothetical protein
MASPPDIKHSLGAILLGGLVSMGLSGALATQCFLYFRIYSGDSRKYKALVLFTWALDAVHSGLIAAAIWKYFVIGFGDKTKGDFIYIEVALTVAFTAVITWIVHLFFAYRVHRLSRGQWLCTVPIVLLAFGRVAAALTSTSEMGMIRSYSGFIDKAGWVFTLGLSFSCAIDIFITMAMCYHLRASRTGLQSSDHLIDMMILYSFENGALTSITTIVTLGCWLAMNDNLIFFGIHFSIAKLYAISLLLTLNTRHTIREAARTSGGSEHQMPVLLPNGHSRRTRSIMTRFPTGQQRVTNQTGTQISINVEKTVTFDVETVPSAQEEMVYPELESARSRPSLQLSPANAGWQ